jgi:hypothetical protein
LPLTSFIHHVVALLSNSNTNQHRSSGHVSHLFTRNCARGWRCASFQECICRHHSAELISGPSYRYLGIFTRLSSWNLRWLNCFGQELSGCLRLRSTLAQLDRQAMRNKCRLYLSVNFFVSYTRLWLKLRLIYRFGCSHTA